MREEFVGFLNDARDKLTREVDIDHGLLNKLLKKKVLTDVHVEWIKKKTTRTTRIEELLDILKERDDNNYSVFRKVLSVNHPGLVKRCLPPDLSSDGTGLKEELLEKKLARITLEKADLQMRINILENRLTSVEDENTYKENEGNLKEKVKQIQNHEKQTSSKSPVPLPRQELEKKSQNAGLSKSEKLKKDCPIKLLENIDDNESLRTKIRKCYARLASSFDPKGYVVDQLFADQIITNDQHHQINQLKSREDRSSTLLHILFTIAHPRSFICFLAALKHDYQWIVDEIDAA